MNNSTDSDAMRYETSDYLQMALFLLFVIVGLPVNLSTLFYMVRRYRHTKSFLLLLHINLNISDILVFGIQRAHDLAEDKPLFLMYISEDVELFRTCNLKPQQCRTMMFCIVVVSAISVLGIYVPGLIGWLITLEWRGGAVLCKVMRFVDVFVLAISSNIMVCIALYRLYALRYPLWISSVGHSYVPRMLLLSWGLAAFTMLPQFYVWKEVDFGDFRQCVTLWTEKINVHGDRMQMTDDDFLLMKLYGIQNACITFYIPLVILVVCYVLILKDIYKTLKSSAPDISSTWYLSDMSKPCMLIRKYSRKERENAVALKLRTIRGQDRLSRAKVRSLRITLLLILVYVITWLPNNLLSWWMVISFDSYRDHQDATFPLAFLVVLNSVINPFIYGRCKGLKMMLCCY